MPVLTCSMCFLSVLWHVATNSYNWWDCRCRIIRGLHCIIFALVAVVDKSAAFGLPAGFHKSWWGGTHQKFSLWPYSRLWGTGWLMGFSGLNESACQICTSSHHVKSNTPTPTPTPVGLSYLIKIKQLFCFSVIYVVSLENILLCP